MKKLLQLLMLWLFISIQVSAQLINVNPDPKGEPWMVGGYELTPEEQAMYDSLPELILTDKARSIILPYKCDNSSNTVNPYFRTIFSQGRDGSCAQASGVGYIFTYMINRERGLASVGTTNLYPSHYTWNYLNRGGNNGSSTLSGWRIIQDSGVPNIQTYGGTGNGMSMFHTDTIKRRIAWMTGYDKYHAALENRVIIDAYSINCNGPEGLETLKHYIHNLAEGDTIKGGGIIGFSVLFRNADYREIPPSSPEEAGKKIVKSWGNTGGHAMTIVGYNDSIKYDFYGDWEYGAVKVANSHGTTYPGGPYSDGFVYMPYRLLSRVHAIKVKESHTPKVTVKTKINHPSRNKINIRAGIAEDASYETPTITQTYAAYSLKRGGDLPMQGYNDDPIEIVLDVSDLLIGIIPAKRIFLEIVQDSDITYNGTILDFSMVHHNTPSGIPIETDFSEQVLPVDIASNTTTTLGINYSYPDESIPESITLSGYVHLRSTITIPEGVTVNIADNSIIHFSDAGNLVVDYSSTLNIGNNVTFTRQYSSNNIIISGEVNVNGRCTSSVDLMVENGGNLEISLNGLKMLSNAGIVVDAGAMLTINSCKEVELTSGSQIVANAGGILKISPNAILNAHEGQGAFSVHSNAIIPQGYINPLDIVPPVYIIKSDTHTWESAEYPMVRYLVVESGAKLVLNSPSLQFKGNVGIIVKEGAELQVNGGILGVDTACLFSRTNWKGITVEGTSRAPQLPEYQGFLTLNGTTIEDALIGVKVEGGGVLDAKNVNFKHNRTSIVFDPYRDGPKPNLSGVFGSTFIRQKVIVAPPGSFSRFIELTDVSMVLFRNNSFINTASEQEIIERGYGLYAYNSDLLIEGRNTFSNLFTAVYAVSTGGVNTLAVKNAEIENCFNGIYVSGYPAPVVENCSIQLPYEVYQDRVPTGISVEVLENFSIERNSVMGRGVGYGIHLNSPLKSGGLVFANHLEDLQVGILAFGYRDFSRVQLRCNQFSENGLADIYVLDGGIDEVQGTRMVSASNRFMGKPMFNIFTSSMPITYYAYPGDYTPESLGGPVSVLKALSLDDCGSGIGIPKPLFTDIAAQDDSLAQAKQILIALQDLGETDALVETVEDETNPIRLRNALLRRSPLLSDTVMVTASADQVPLPNLMLAQVLMGNPQAAKSAAVLQALDERENALPDYLLEAIHGAGSGFSPIDGAKAEVARHRATRDILTGRLLARFTADTLGKPYDSIRMLPDHHPDRIYRYLSAFTHVEQGNLPEALIALQSMAGEPGLTPEQLQETEGVSQLVNVLAELEQAGIPLEHMDSLTRSTLEGLTTDGVGLAALLAGNALAVADTIPFLAQELAVGEAYSGTQTGEWSILLELEPFPVTDYVLAAYDLGGEPCRNPQMQVINGRGDVMYSEALTRTRFEVLVEVEGWRPGVYTVNLLDGELVLAQRSFLILGHDEGAEAEELETHELLGSTGITLHPNPANGFVMVNFQQVQAYSNVVFEVFSIHGLKLLSKPINLEQSTLNISSFPAGMYLYRFTADGLTVKTGKLINQ